MNLENRSQGAATSLRWSRWHSINQHNQHIFSSPDAEYCQSDTLLNYNSLSIVKLASTSSEFEKFCVAHRLTRSSNFTARPSSSKAGWFVSCHMTAHCARIHGSFASLLLLFPASCCFVARRRVPPGRGCAGAAGSIRAAGGGGCCRGPCSARPALTPRPVEREVRGGMGVSATEGVMASGAAKVPGG